MRGSHLTKIESAWVIKFGKRTPLSFIIKGTFHLRQKVLREEGLSSLINVLFSSKERNTIPQHRKLFFTVQLRSILINSSLRKRFMFNLETLWERIIFLTNRREVHVSFAFKNSNIQLNLLVFERGSLEFNLKIRFAVALTLNLRLTSAHRQWLWWLCCRLWFVVDSWRQWSLEWNFFLKAETLKFEWYLSIVSRVSSYGAKPSWGESLRAKELHFELVYLKIKPIHFPVPSDFYPPTPEIWILT